MPDKIYFYLQSTAQKKMADIYGMNRKRKTVTQKKLIARAQSDPRFLLYSGYSEGFENKVQEISILPPGYTEAHIIICGEPKKEIDTCCLITTLILSCFIIPLCMMCCNWWKQIVNAVHDVPVSTYQLLQAIILRPEISTLTLVVYDNCFDAQKAKILYDLLSRSNLKYFKFFNGASNYDCMAQQFSTFEQNMKPIKMLPIKSELGWSSIAVQ